MLLTIMDIVKRSSSACPQSSNQQNKTKNKYHDLSEQISQIYFIREVIIYDDFCSLCLCVCVFVHSIQTPALIIYRNRMLLYCCKTKKQNKEQSSSG